MIKQTLGSIWSTACRRRQLVGFQESAGQFANDIRTAGRRGRNTCCEKIQATGVNEYRGNVDAIAEGKKTLYRQLHCLLWCGWHGKNGPHLVGKDVVYPQALTDPGMFSIAYGGAGGAM